MTFKLYDCDTGISINGVNYEFDHVVDVVMDDPEMNKLTRGANAKNKVGLAYREGITEAKTITTQILGITPAQKSVLDAAYEAQTRIDFYCTSRADGSSIVGSNCLLSKIPRQLNVNDSPDSMSVQIMLTTFDLVENHKS